jgi:hypothetical protein
MISILIFLMTTFRYFALDNVSIRDFVASNTDLLTNGNFETGDLSSWVYCNQNNASSTGGVKSNMIKNSFFSLKLLH